MKLNRKILFATFLIGIAASPVAMAQENTFTNASGTAITNGANWTQGVPAFGTTITSGRWNINGTTEYTTTQGNTVLNNGRDLVISNGNGTSGQLTLAGGSITLGGSTAASISTPSGTGEGHGTLILSGGNLTTPGEISVLARGSNLATGVLTINTGSKLTADIVSFGLLGTSAGTGTINVNSGGTLEARVIYDVNAVANSIVNVNGGTLKGSGAIPSNDFVRGSIEVLNIGASGATIDTNGASQRIRPSGGISGSGDISITGGGTAWLSGTSSNTGTLNVNASILRLDSNAWLQNDINVNSGSTLTGEGFTETGAVTFTAGTTMVFDPSTTGSSGYFAADSIDTTAGATTKINIVPTTVLVGTDIVVMESTGGSIAGSLTDFKLNARGTLKFGTVSFANDQLLVDVGAAANLTWKGANGTHPTFWDFGVTSDNFNIGASPDFFYSGDNVTFDDTASNFSPAAQAASSAGALSFSNSSNAYTLSGGKITAASLTKTGAAGVTFNQSIDAATASISGGKVTLTQTSLIPDVTINSGGEIQLGDGVNGGGHLGNGTVVNDGTLSFNFGGTQVDFNHAKVFTGSGNIDKYGSGTLIMRPDISLLTGTTTIHDGIFRIMPNGAVNFNNVIAGSSTGTLSVALAASLLTFDLANTYHGPTSISAGAIILDGAGTPGSTTSGTSVSGTGTLALKGGATVPAGEALNIAGQGAATADYFYVGSSGIRGAVQSIGGSNTIDGPVTLSSTGARLGVQDGAQLTVNGTINGGAYDIGLRAGGTATSTISLSGAITTTGITYIYNGVTTDYASSGRVITGAANVFSPTSLLLLGTFISAGNVDLNGNSQTIAGIATAATADAATLASATITSATPATLTTNPAANANFGGTISGAISIVKTGAFVQELSGTTSFAGNVTVSGGGVLRITNASSLNDAAVINLTGTGALDLPAAGTDNVAQLVINGVSQQIGLYDSTNSSGAITGSGKLNVTVGAGGYSTWASTNADSQTADLDFDGDGTPNGVEYFMNAPAGFTANPSLGVGNSITWSNGGNIPGSAYETKYVIQTSANLVDWSNVPVGDLTTNTNGPGGSLTYTLTGAGPRFVRLKVTPN